MNSRGKRRAETRRQQREAGAHFHPRSLARSVARATLISDGYEQLNKRQAATAKSKFAKAWRITADAIASER